MDEKIEEVEVPCPMPLSLQEKSDEIIPSIDNVIGEANFNNSELLKSEENRNSEVLETKSQRVLCEKIENAINNIGSGEKEEVEDLILEVTRILNMNKGTIPPNLKCKINKLASQICPFVKQIEPRKEESNANTQGIEIPPCMQNIRDEALIGKYFDLSNRFQQKMKFISAKTISRIKCLEDPCQLIKNIGQLIVTLSNEIKTLKQAPSNYKKANFAIKWDRVQKELSNNSHIVQSLRKLQTYIESPLININNVIKTMEFFIGSPIISDIFEVQKKVEAFSLYEFLMAAFEFAKFLKISRDSIIQKDLITDKSQKIEKQKQMSEKENELEPNVGVSPQQVNIRETTQIDMKISEKEVQHANEMDSMNHEIENSEKMIKELMLKKKEIQRRYEKKLKEESTQKQKEDHFNYLKYKQELSEAVQIDTTSEKIADLNYASEMLNEQIEIEKARKAKKAEEEKLNFLEDLEKEKAIREMKQEKAIELKEEEFKVHEEFIKKLDLEKNYKLEQYALEKLSAHEDRTKSRKKELEFKQKKLKNKQEELMEELEFLKNQTSA